MKSHQTCDALAADGAEVEVAPIPDDLDNVAFLDLLLEQLRRQRIGDPLLEHALERPGAVGWLVPLPGELGSGFVGHAERQPNFGELPLQPLELDVDDLGELGQARADGR